MLGIGNIRALTGLAGKGCKPAPKAGFRLFGLLGQRSPTRAAPARPSGGCIIESSRSNDCFRRGFKRLG
jgi:hypothetical protein